MAEPPRSTGPQLYEMGVEEHASRGHATVALRLIAEDHQRPVRCIGTAIIAGRGIAITAKHVVTDAIAALGYDVADAPKVLETGVIKLYQITMAGEYVTWSVSNMFLQTLTDLAL